MTGTADDLVADGVLTRIVTRTDERLYAIPSPLVWSLIMHIVAPHTHFKIAGVLRIVDGKLDVFAVLKLGLPCFSAAIMQAAMFSSCKANATAAKLSCLS